MATLQQERRLTRTRVRVHSLEKIRQHGLSHQTAGSTTRAPSRCPVELAIKRGMHMHLHHFKFKIVFECDRHVQRGDFSILVETFNPDDIGRLGLRQYCDSVRVFFAGFPHETKAPYTIPELRTFLRALRSKWPYAPYFCDLNNSFVAIEAMAHVENFSVIERADSDVLYFRINIPELERYVMESHRTIRILGRLSGMSKSEICKRVERFDEYIKTRLGP